MNGAATAITQVDVFTTEPFTGAPAAVCLTADEPEESWMVGASREMACSNTAFAQRRASGDGYNLRWFTAGGVEIDLCGHATLATAHILFENGELVDDEVAQFHTRSGLLTANRRSDGRIAMSFPVERPSPIETVPREIIDGFGTNFVWMGRNRLDYLLEIESERDLRALKPNLTLLERVETRGFIVTARAYDPGACGYDYALRFFAPRVGIAEDMVTGTAHCALAPYWNSKLANQERFVAFQASPREGRVHVELQGNRVLISGKAVTVLQGMLSGGPIAAAGARHL
jgi:PhzF family phenazine biosynthesis protein